MSAVGEPQRRSLSLAEAYRDVHAEFSGRTVTLLVSNDLRGALDCAAIAFYALELAEGRGHRPRHVIRGHQGVRGEGPTAVQTRVTARLAHLQPQQ